MDINSLSNVGGSVKVGEFPGPLSPQTSTRIRTALPEGHLYFPDCLRENHARHIAWAISRKEIETWFVTQTFRDYERPSTAVLLFRRWFGHLTDASMNATGHRLRYSLVTEWQKREVIHLHSLVQGRELFSASRKRWEHRWQVLTLNTGFCRIYDADRKIAPYLAKYTSKALGGDMIVGGYWQGLHTPASVACRHSL